MKKLSLSLAAAGSLLLASLGSAFAAGATDYQVTGPVLAVTDTTITVQKGKDKWELNKDASTQGAAALKVGDKVTIHYTMTATTVEAKPAAAAKTAKKDAKAPAGAAASPAATGAAPASSPAAQ